jgi:hypothetical protein
MGKRTGYQTEQELQLLAGQMIELLRNERYEAIVKDG